MKQKGVVDLTKDGLKFPTLFEQEGQQRACQRDAIEEKLPKKNDPDNSSDFPGILAVHLPGAVKAMTHAELSRL